MARREAVNPERSASPVIAERIWESKYRHGDENHVSATWSRVANAIASAEADSGIWTTRFFGLLSGFRFLPGGRVLAGAGTGKDVTLFNCFVSGALEDSLESIFESLKETALTMQHGGGIGLDFSPLRPAGTTAERTGAVASGPVSFMQLWDLQCRTLLETSSRRGAMMGTLACDHPDIVAFIDAKRERDALGNFNLSVLVTDAFMRAVDDDAEWPLRFPSGSGSVVASMPARELWQRIVRAAHETAEPGVLFVDTINRENNLRYCESLTATNPCGEVPLPPHGACDLGSINLTTFVASPFSSTSAFDWQTLKETVAVAVRFLDDVIDVSRFPLEAQAEQARSTRRIGLGITGLADMLAMLGLHYDSDEARRLAIEIMQNIRDTAYATSIGLAAEKGAFPAFEREGYLDSPFIKRLPETLRNGIAANGIRNSHLLAIAPAGTISLLAGNVSSGIEPIYSLEGERTVRCGRSGTEVIDVQDFAWKCWLDRDGDDQPASIVTADELPPQAHLAMQACLQPFVDGAISKTVNLPGPATTEDVGDLFHHAWLTGVKGCTVYRPGARAGQVLRGRSESHCCHVDREAD